MSLSDLWPVLVQDATEALVLANPDVPDGWSAGVVLAAGDSGAANGLQVRIGGGTSFAGNNSGTVQTAVTHGLSETPVWVDIFPALTNTGSGWGAMTFQYEAADISRFYVEAFTNAGTFGSGLSYFFNWIAVALL